MNDIKDHLETIKQAPLFRGIESSELEAMLKCIGAVTKNVEKGGFFLLAGDKPRHIGIALSGQLHVIYENLEGSRSLITAITPGEIFAEALCCAGISESPVTVMAAVDSNIVRIEFSRIIHTCSNLCSFHTKLIENMLGLLAAKNLLLQTRIELLSIKSIRARVLSYLESFAHEQGRNITIPFNREELADYLCVDRSALSHELMKMKKDELIEYRKNKFLLKI